MQLRKKKTILVITGTRAEYGLLRPVIFELQKSRNLKPTVLVTGMHTLRRYGMTIREIRRDGINPACVVSIPVKHDMLSALSREIVGVRKFCLKLRPDGILILGDRDEPFAGAIVGAHLGIPVAHMRGGELTGRVVDESIRHAITKLSNLHLVATTANRKHVVKMGENPQNVFVTGATEVDGIHKNNLLKKNIIAQRYDIDASQPWMIVLHHPTALDATSIYRQIRPLLTAIKQYKQFHKIVIYPNSDSGSSVFIREIEKLRGQKNFSVFKNLPRGDYHDFLASAQILIGNSSSGIVESAYFHIPVVNIGHRQDGRERAGNVIDCGFSGLEIKSALARALSVPFRRKCMRVKAPYGGPGASGRIVQILERYIGRKGLIWKKFYGREACIDAKT